MEDFGRLSIGQTHDRAQPDSALPAQVGGGKHVTKQSLRDRFVAVLTELGGSAGNGRLRAALAWTEATYDAVKGELGVVGELAGEVRRQAEGVLRSHTRLHPKIVCAIEWRLARGSAEVALHGALALHLVVSLVLQRLEFLDGYSQLGDDFFVLG